MKCQCTLALRLFVFLLFASATTWAQLPGRFVSFGANTDDLHGRAVSAAGDVNNDGIPDYVVGTVGDDTNGLNAGKATVYSGADGSVLYDFFGDAAGDEFGLAVDGAGDVNNDGFDDVIVGAYLNDGTALDAGLARVFSGKDGSILYTKNGLAAGDEFGVSVDGVGDLNADGFDEFCVGAWKADSNGLDAGSVYVYSGIDGSLLRSHNGDAAGDQFGTSLSVAGSMTPDGVPEYIVGAMFASALVPAGGMARVFDGATGATLATSHGANPLDLLGFSVAGAGDVNGDSVDDVIVGSLLGDGGGMDSGEATVYSGADGSVIHKFFGFNPGDSFGFAVDGAGDVNGDGIPDLICGAPTASVTGPASGAAYLFSGSTGVLLERFAGFSAGDQLGITVAGLGDVNGDLFGEVILGAPFVDSLSVNLGLCLVMSHGGKRLYTGTPNPFFTLSLDWVADSSTPGWEGFVRCTGAIPGASGISAVSLFPNDALIFGGFPVVIAIDAANLQGTLNFGFDIHGEHIAPIVIKSPVTAGVSFFVQYFSDVPVPAASNGLELRVVR